MTRSLSTRLPAVALALASIIGCADGASDPSAPPIPVPDAGDTRCAARGSARTRARYCESQARAGMDAYALNPAAGVDAIAWLAEAQACYEAAQAMAPAAEAASALANWRRRLSRDLRTYHLRLQLAVRQARTEAAVAEIQRLRTLLRSSEPSPYHAWLDALQRRLS